jgi:hypothetical protein
LIKRIKQFWERLLKRFKAFRKPKPMGTAIFVKKETNPLDVDLVDDNLNTKDKKQLRQYTKCLVTALTVMACIWITISYIYAGIGLFLYGNPEVLIELSKQVCVTILGVTISYCLKAYMETYSEAKHIEDMAKIEQTVLPSDEDGEAVG